MVRVTTSELENQNRAMRAAYCEDIEDYNRFREEEESGAVRQASLERPPFVQAEFRLRRSQ